MQLERENQNVPVPAAFLFGQVRQAAEAAVHVGFTRIGHSADNFFPLGAELGKFLKTVLAGEPCALAFVKPGKKFIHILPDAVAVQYLQDNVVAHGHGDAGVEKIARVHDHRLAAPLGFKGTQGAQKIVD